MRRRRAEMGGAPGAITDGNANGTYGRFRYIEAIACYAVVNRVDEPMFVMRRTYR